MIRADTFKYSGIIKAPNHSGIDVSKQECIPVGCIPPTCWPYSFSIPGVVCPSLPWRQNP